jgi:hypothetical protein
MRTAEKEYEKNPTAFNRGVMTDLQNKCDGWIKWFHDREQGKTATALPPFIGQVSRSGEKTGLSAEVINHLMKTHTQEEVERFMGMFGQ